MKAVKDLIRIIHRLKYNSKLSKDDKRKAFIMLIFITSAIVEMVLAISNIHTNEISSFDYKLLEIFLAVFVASLIALLSLD